MTMPATWCPTASRLAEAGLAGDAELVERLVVELHEIVDAEPDLPAHVRESMHHITRVRARTARVDLATRA